MNRRQIDRDKRTFKFAGKLFNRGLIQSLSALGFFFFFFFSFLMAFEHTQSIFDKHSAKRFSDFIKGFTNLFAFSDLFQSPSTFYGNMILF